MEKKTKIVTELLWFNGITAVAGGMALITGVVKHSSWILKTDFNSLYFPGVILMCLVGGSAIIAAIAAMKKVIGWELAAITSAVILLGWITGEIVSIRTFHILQLIYIATAIKILFTVPSIKSAKK